MNICLVDGCNGKVIGHGYCSKHYYRKKRNGSPFSVKRVRQGLSKTHHETWGIFWNMHARCERNTHPAYKYYGERGIKVCDRWSGPYGFAHFLEDMGDAPEERYPSGRRKYSLDRIDPDGDYCPENCRWANANVQATNTTRSRKYSKSPGVTYNIKTNVWWAYIQVNGKRHIKTARSESDAIKKRKELEEKYLNHI